MEYLYTKISIMTNIKIFEWDCETDEISCYGAKGIRVTKTEEISAAFEEAKKNTKTPTLIEFIIDPEEMVYPMIKPGGTLEDMIMDC